MSPSIEMVNIGGDPLPLDDAEDCTQLRRTLSERHVNMIAFSSVVGIGLFLQAGKIVSYAGPGLAILAYLITGSVTWSALACLGEMTALFPVRGAVFEFPARFIDKSVGFTVGWMTWYQYLITIAAEATAVAQLFNFRFDPKYLADAGYPDPTLGWRFGQDAHPAVWVGLFLIFIFLMNLLPARVYGEIEYVFGCCKITFIVLLILFNVIINTHGAAPHNNPNPFRNYDNPYSFGSRNFTVHGKVFTGGPGHLASMWTAMTTAVFGMSGFNAVAITAAESKDLEKDESIKLATRKICLRIVLLYTLAVFAVGLNVPYTDANLRVYAANSIPSGEHSIFIIAAVRARLRGWPHFFNAFFIFSATSSGVNALFMCSRLLHALALTPGAWPRWKIAMIAKAKLERTVWGVPMAAVSATWVVGLVSFLAVSPYPNVILGRVATNSVVSALIAYCIICVAYLKFYKCIDRAAQGLDTRTDPNQDLRFYNREDDRFYPYKTHGQYLRAIYGICGCGLFVLFNGWRSFVPPMNIADFFSSYINIPVFVLIFIAYRINSQGWDPRQWRGREASEDLHNPISVSQVNPRLRRGRLRRANRKDSFSRENAMRFVQWIWEWLK
ncbi:hypothetical protein GP486_001413 [Trichoglossum hirsutum]|uniref:Amino acid permease/ SLC12A domain-containing protein n=1 Tax=Trichoglossum hirsutum TaxID=265104 RepID=A0A9P8LH22_9PEZI|nr:hypothetical protein GP486_001413 [Trichoglossum hirsutum]